MKKSYTKNMLSVAPTINMFSKITKQQKQSSAILNQSGTKNPAMKYTRSISSFRKVYKESPEKKQIDLGMKTRPTISKSATLNPFDRILHIFHNQITAKTQESLYDDFIQRIQHSVKILEQAIQSQSLIKILKELKTYFSKIFNILLKITENQINIYNEQILIVCQQYQKKIKQLKKSEVERMRKQFLCAQSQIGKKLNQMKQKNLNCSLIFNQMERASIDVQQWVKGSQFIGRYILKQDVQFSKIIDENDQHMAKIQKLIQIEDDKKNIKKIKLTNCKLQNNDVQDQIEEWLQIQASYQKNLFSNSKQPPTSTTKFQTKSQLNKHKQKR